MTRDVPLHLRAIAGLLGIVLVGAMVTFIIQYSNGALAGGYDIEAVFARAGQGLYVGNDVKIRGVGVGTVRRIGLTNAGKALVTLHMNPGTRVADTASASIQALSVFGPKYVELDPGPRETEGPFLRSGAVITRTAPATELFDLLQQTGTLLRAINTGDLSTVIQTVGQSLDGLGPTIGQMLDSTATIAAASRVEIPELEALLTNLAQFTADVDSKGAEFVATAGNLNQVLPEIGAHPDRLTNLLDQTSLLSAQVAGLLEGHQTAVTSIIDGLSTATSGALAPQTATIVSFVTSLETFFSLLTGIIRLRTNRADKLGGMVQGYLPTDLCALFTGFPLPQLCGQGSHP